MKRIHRLLPMMLFLIPLALGAMGGEDHKETVDQVWQTLVSDLPSGDLPVQPVLHISDEAIVNAWATPKTGDVYITEQMLGLLGDNKDEIAFVLGHEIGHVLGYWTGMSAQLQKPQMEEDLGNLLSALGLLLESGEAKKNRYSQVEERLADAIGFHLIWHVGYNPHDAAGFFGKLQMYQGATDPGVRMWMPYLLDHPFDEDRIDNLRLVMQQLEEKKPETDLERQKATVRDIRTVGAAIEMFAVDHNVYPGPTQGLVKTRSYLRPILEPTYLRNLPIADGWGQPFWYSSNGVDYTLISYSKDGNPDDQRGGVTNSFDCDIVFAAGQFYQWPSGTQR